MYATDEQVQVMVSIQNIYTTNIFFSCRLISNNVMSRLDGLTDIAQLTRNYLKQVHNLMKIKY